MEEQNFEMTNILFTQELRNYGEKISSDETSLVSTIPVSKEDVKKFIEGEKKRNTSLSTQRETIVPNGKFRLVENSDHFFSRLPPFTNWSLSKENSVSCIPLGAKLKKNALFCQLSKLLHKRKYQSRIWQCDMQPTKQF